MDRGLNKKLVYPEYSTFVSHKLDVAPAGQDVPVDGHVYQWESVAAGVTYVNVKYSNGDVRSYPLDSGAQITEYTPSLIDDSLEFEASDIVTDDVTGEKYLDMDEQYVVADISFYKSDAKTESDVVSLPVTLLQNGTRIHFDDVDANDYSHGGKVRFSRGVIYLYAEDTTYIMPTSTGNLSLDVSLGYTYIVSNISNDCYISKSGVSNLPVNKLFKVVVNNMSGHDVYVEGSVVPFEKFFVCYMNLNGTVCQMGKVIEID